MRRISGIDRKIEEIISRRVSEFLLLTNYYYEVLAVDVRIRIQFSEERRDEYTVLI
jgi:hypothetical protein